MKNTIIASYFEIFNPNKQEAENKVSASISLQSYEAFTYNGSKKQPITGSQLVIEKDYVYCVKPKNSQYFYLVCPVYGKENIVVISKELLETLQKKSCAFTGDLNQEFEDLKGLRLKSESPSKKKVALIFTIDQKEKDKGLNKYFEQNGFKQKDILKKENGSYKFCFLYYKVIDTKDVKGELVSVKKLSKEIQAKFKGIRIVIDCVYDINSKVCSPKKFMNAQFSRISGSKEHKLQPISLVKKYKLW